MYCCIKYEEELTLENLEIKFNNKTYKCSYLKGSNRYQCKLPIDKDSRKALYGNNINELQEKADEYQKLIEDKLKIIISTNFDSNQDNNLSCVSATTVFDEALREKYKEIKPSSYDRLDSVYRLHIKPILQKDNLTISEVSPDIIASIIEDAIFVKKFTKSSVKKFFEVFNSVFDYATEKYIFSNPMDSNRIRNVRKKLKLSKKNIKRNIYSDSDILMLKNIIYKFYLKDESPTHRYFPVFLFIMNTGLRAGEASALKWKDISTDRKSISIKHSILRYSERDENLQLVGKQNKKLSYTKTDASVRNIPLNANALKALDLIIESNKRSNINSDFIFAKYDGNFCSTDTLEKSFKNLTRLAKLDNYGIHSLRHLFATMLASKSVNPSVISDLLGHTDVAFSLNNYVTALPKDKIDAVNLL